MHIYSQMRNVLVCNITRTLAFSNTRSALATLLLWETWQSGSMSNKDPGLGGSNVT